MKHRPSRGIQLEAHSKRESKSKLELAECLVEAASAKLGSAYAREAAGNLNGIRESVQRTNKPGLLSAKTQGRATSVVTRRDPLSQAIKLTPLLLPSTGEPQAQLNGPQWPLQQMRKMSAPATS